MARKTGGERMGRNILVVEDDKNISDLIYMYLVKEGFDVRIAGDGGKALEEFQKKEPDLILLDIMLPGDDGYTILAKIRQMPEVDVLTETLEENAMVQYKDRQTMAVIKGVQNNFEQLTAIDSILYGAGEFLLNDSIVDYGVMGIELVSTLGTGIRFVDPLQYRTGNPWIQRFVRIDPVSDGTVSRIQTVILIPFPS